jgi:integrase/recombinase XerD
VTPLRQRMLEDLQIRRYSPTTIRLYLHSVAQFAQHFHTPPDQLGPEHIRQYQLFLIKDRILDHTRNLKHWTILATLYATALRANELRHLKVSDIDGERMVLHVRQALSLISPWRPSAV